MPLDVLRGVLRKISDILHEIIFEMMHADCLLTEAQLGVEASIWASPTPGVMCMRFGLKYPGQSWDSQGAFSCFELKSALCDHPPSLYFGAMLSLFLTPYQRCFHKFLFPQAEWLQCLQAPSLLFQGPPSPGHLLQTCSSLPIG